MKRSTCSLNILWRSAWPPPVFKLRAFIGAPPAPDPWPWEECTCPPSSGAIDSLAANPAGLTLLGGRTLDLSITSIFAQGSFSNSVNTNVPLKDAPGVIPYGAFGMPIGHSRFSIGFGVVPELMSVSNWNYVDAPGVAGASYGLQKQNSAILAARAVREWALR